MSTLRGHLFTWRIILGALLRHGPRAGLSEWLQRYRYGRLTGRWLQLWYWSIGGNDGLPPPGADLAKWCPTRPDPFRHRPDQRTFRPRRWKRPICWFWSHQTVEMSNLIEGSITTRCLRCDLRTRRHA